MYQSQKRRRIKPFARPTSFDINVVYDIRHYQSIKYGNVIDPYFPAHGTDEAYHVLEGEVLMQTNTKQVRRYGDHQLHVFSFANGLKADGAVLNASYNKTKKVLNEKGEEVEVDVEVPEKAAVLEGLKYAGVAVTEFSPEKDIFEQGFVMTMAGLNTIFNNGASILYPGDVVCADIPFAAARGVKKNRALQTGIPREKLQFIVTPYRDLLAAVGDDEVLASRFIMGTALSYSRPGSSVDIVLHRCNAVIRRRGGDASVDASKERSGGGFMGVPAESSKKTKKTKSKDKK
tara:strand:- start:6118 stop:6984 length:867 start_codon:yes stop_codon:yes gene_type:complete